jgi:hypothetical protein
MFSDMSLRPLPLLFERTEANEVYQKLDATFPLRLKAQLKGSGLDFQHLVELPTSSADQPSFLLVLGRVEVKFSTVDQLLGRMADAVRSELGSLREEIEDLQCHKSNDMHPDEYYIDQQIDGLYHREGKLCKVLERIEHRIGEKPKGPFRPSSVVES